MSPTAGLFTCLTEIYYMKYQFRRGCSVTPALVAGVQRGLRRGAVGRNCAGRGRDE